MNKENIKSRASKPILVGLGIVISVLVLLNLVYSEQKDLSGLHRHEESETLLKEGLAFEKTGELNQAIATYEKLIDQYPSTWYEDLVGKGIYSEDARDRLNVIYCIKRRGPDYSTASREEIAQKIKELFNDNRVKSFFQYASCDFKVGKPETDAVWRLSPKLAETIFDDLRELLDWSTETFDLSGYLTVREAVQKNKHVFALKEFSGRWKWVGYYTSNNQILDSMWKIKKQIKKHD